VGEQFSVVSQKKSVVQKKKIGLAVQQPVCLLEAKC
jgi:hypothetical protein